MQREEPVGARLRDPGTEGRPGAAGLKGVGPDVSLVTGKSAGRPCPNSGGTTETVSALKPDGFRAVFVGEEAEMMEFEVNMVYQKEDIAAVQRGTAIRRYRGKPLKRAMNFFGTYILIHFLVALLFSLFSSVLETVGIMPTVQSIEVLFSIVIVISLALTIYDQWGNRQRFSTWLSWRKIRKKKRQTIQFHFSEENFCVHTDDSDVRSSYSVIAEALESPTHYLLFVNENMAYALAKKNFLKGDPAIFGTWLAEKLGKEIIKMH